MLWARVGVVSAGVGGRADREMGGSGPAEGGSHSSPGQTHSPSTTMTVILSPPIPSPPPPLPVPVTYLVTRSPVPSPDRPLGSPLHLPANFLHSHYQMDNDAPTPSSAYRSLILGKRERFSGACSGRGKRTHSLHTFGKQERERSLEKLVSFSTFLRRVVWARPLHLYISNYNVLRYSPASCTQPSMELIAGGSP